MDIWAAEKMREQVPARTGREWKHTHLELWHVIIMPCYINFHADPLKR